MLTNEKIGRLFEITYFPVDHIARSIKVRLEQHPDLKEKNDRIDS